MGWDRSPADNRVREVWSKAARTLGLTAFRRIVRRTPVDEGTAKANWHTSVGSSSDAVDMSRRTVQSPDLNLTKLRDFQPIFIQNNVPYIGPLEYGHSGQAPAGMVRVTVAEFGGRR